MNTLFGIPSNIAVVTVAALYLIVSLHTSIYGIQNFKDFLSGQRAPSGYLLINTSTNVFQIFSSVLSVSCFLSSILLILGILEKRYMILRPWLFVNLLIEFILAHFCFYLVFLLIEAYNSSWRNVCGLLLAIFCNLTIIAFHDYMRNGVYILYKKFQKDSRRLYRVIDNEDNEGVYNL